jgi:D-amino-acid dehydrogenase
MKVVIVGAGILGASAGYHLVRAGAAVTIVDQAHEGQATAAGAGIVSPWGSGEADNLDWYRIAAAGARFYPQLVEQLGEDGERDVGYRRVGALLVSTEPAKLAAVEARLRERAKTEPAIGAVSALTPREASALFPPLAASFSALHIAGAARVDGRQTAAALVRAAGRHGATLLKGAARLLAAGSCLGGVVVGGETIEADRVILAAGAWTPELLAPLGIRLQVRPQRGQIVHLRMPGVETGAWPVVLRSVDNHYLLSFDDSHVVAGATRENEAGFDHRVTVAGLAEVLREALATAPGLAPATVLETRIGFRPMSPDGKPLLGPMPELKGLLVGTGLGPSGLTIGPYAGKLLADAALGREAEIDMSAYNPQRASATAAQDALA